MKAKQHKQVDAPVKPSREFSKADRRKIAMDKIVAKRNRKK